MLKVLELFAGIGACSSALDRLGIEHEIVDAVEIDKYAMASFNAIHGTNFEVQDICAWNKDIECDLIMHGSPCQDFSLAGKQAGGDIGSGTRSSLMYETIRIVGKLRPKFVIWENVKNILSQKHRHNFDNYLTAMESLGYRNYYQVLNAKDYGIPQNRERVFTISIRKDIEKEFEFPPKQELKLRLKDMLEDEVDEKYYLSQEHIERIQNWKSYQNPLDKVYGQESIIDTITTRVAESDGGGISASAKFVNESLKHTESLRVKNATKQGYLEAQEGDGIDISSRMQYHRGNVQKQMCQTIVTNGNERGVVVSAAQRGREDGQQIEISDREYANAITTVQKDSMISMVNLPQIVRVRKYPINIDKLKETLINAKNKVGITNSRLAFELEQPITTVEHWFRNDNCFSIPNEDIWFQLKNLLEITTNEFDEAITTFEKREGVYEKSNRVYGQDGIAPTLTQQQEKIIVTNRNAKHQQDLVQETYGVCRTIPAGTHGSTPHLLKTIVNENPLRIRKLTPRECFKLMGFTDEEFDKAQSAGISNSQLYKQARKLNRCQCTCRDI